MSKKLGVNTSLHPGTVLLKQFMEPNGISQNALARSLHVPPRRINEIVHGKRAITSDTAVRLGRYFGNGPKFWLILQTNYDIEDAFLKVDIDAITPLIPSL